MSYPANHRINLGDPFEKRAKARPRQKLRMQRAIAYLNHAIDLAVAPPFPESTPIFPTDNASHWESLFMEEGIAPPLPEIASFVMHLRGLIDAAGGRPVHPVAQTNSSSSGSAQTRKHKTRDDASSASFKSLTKNSQRHNITDVADCSDE